MSFEDLLRRDEISLRDLQNFGDFPTPAVEISDKIEIAIKYDGYIRRQNELVEQTGRLDNFKIPKEFDFATVVGFSTEEREKLCLIRPETVGQARRISGVNPSAIQALLINLKGREKIKNLSTR
jgi:tRNA uridine 5-carboxymethylaminomethyl modification enzyme